MTQRPQLIEPPELILPRKQLTLEELPFLNRLGHVENGTFRLEHSLKGYSLKTPVTVTLESLLRLGQKGLAEYIITALISQRPRLIPWVLENQSLIALANHMLRSKSGSLMGFYGYTSSVDLYCRRLRANPDQVIADTKPDGLQPEPARLEKHRRFLADCLGEMQDRGVSPGRLHGYSRHVRTWYRCNDVEIRPPGLPQPRVVYKDRAPTSQELQRILDFGGLRERTIISMLALGGFREGTLAGLQYRHVKEDLEKGIVPVRVHIEAEISKGHYCDYDTFLGGEAVEYLRLYLDQRRSGSTPRKDSSQDPARQKIPPEEIRDKSPLIRDSHSANPRPIGEKEIYKVVHNLYHKAGLLKDQNRRFDLRVHSIRKYFKTQLKALGVDGDYIDYWMGHMVDTYHDIQSKGVEFLRDIYARAGLTIRPQKQLTPTEMLKKMVRSIGMDPDKVLNKEALAEPHRIYSTPEEQEQEEIALLTKALMDGVKTQPQDSNISRAERILP